MRDPRSGKDSDRTTVAAAVRRLTGPVIAFDTW
jgi:hypothetical protein